MGSWGEGEGGGAGDSRREPMSFSADQWTIDKLPTLEKWKREKAASLKLPRRVSRWERGEKGECLFVSVRQSESERERESERMKEWCFSKSKNHLQNAFTHSPFLSYSSLCTRTHSHAHPLPLTLARTYIKEWIFKKLRAGGCQRQSWYRAAAFFQFPPHLTISLQKIWIFKKIVFCSTT